MSSLFEPFVPDSFGQGGSGDIYSRET